MEDNTIENKIYIGMMSSVDKSVKASVPIKLDGNLEHDQEHMVETIFTAPLGIDDGVTNEIGHTLVGGVIGILFKEKAEAAILGFPAVEMDENDSSYTVTACYRLEYKD